MKHNKLKIIIRQLYSRIGMQCMITNTIMICANSEMIIGYSLKKLLQREEAPLQASQWKSSNSKGLGIVNTF